MSYRKSNKIARSIIDAAYHVHIRLGGPSYTMTVYRTALTLELEKRGHHVQPEAKIFIEDDAKYDKSFIVDLLVDDLVIAQILTVEDVEFADRKKVLSYVRLAERWVGLLLNFGAAHLKDGVYKLERDMVL